MSPIIRQLIWLAFFLLPSEGGIIDGIPVGRVELAGLLLVCWIAAHRVPLRGARFAAVAAVAAMLATAALPGERGLHARYYATAAASDHTRFNCIRMGDPDRRHLEFSAA